MKRGKEALKELYNFEGFSFNEICKEISVIIYIKKKGKTGICPVCNKKRRKVIEVRQRKVRDVNFGNEKCYITFYANRIRVAYCNDYLWKLCNITIMGKRAICGYDK